MDSDKQARSDKILKRSLIIFHLLLCVAAIYVSYIDLRELLYSILIFTATSGLLSAISYRYYRFGTFWKSIDYIWIFSTVMAISFALFKLSLSSQFELWFSGLQEVRITGVAFYEEAKRIRL